LTTKSRSCEVSGPPRAHEARLPARRNWISSSRKAAAALFMDSAIACMVSLRGIAI
jgi:hypothetical protein